MSKGKRTWLIVLGLVLAGANLRLPITMMPPILPELEAQIGLPSALAGLLTTIPLLAFAVASPFMGKAGAKHGNGTVLCMSLAVLCIGSYFRIVPSTAALLIGTVAVGIGIAGGNVLLPAVIKESFPDSTASKTTLYTTTMGLVASLGTATSGVIASHVSVRGSMGLFSLVGPVALVVWLVIVMVSRNSKQAGKGLKNAADRPMMDKSPWRSPLAWVILLYFGLQSILYYSLVTWLPAMLKAVGFSAVAAGNLATLFQLCGLPLTLLTPTLAERRHGLAIVNVIVGAGFGVGLLGLMLSGSNMAVVVVAIVLMGFATAAAFSICVVFFQKRTSSADDTARLSGMAQSGGYIIAAIGPVAFGALNGVVGSWMPVKLLMIAITAVLFVAGVVIIRHHDIYEGLD
ncbi:MFS transporter [Bifidobacterium sp. ESL0682]|uniref:MFS transporter n=1 Tax=Bifidobacterium sp. ESL0682 TaxID=2983212 RepID=UPI0023FA413E|nr:MFS transporter [Bifidobacterium sp. ESL0682]WEV42549.1 MFS transporter [Bifidobacterium sp. ESL0682]